MNATEKLIKKRIDVLSAKGELDNTSVLVCSANILNRSLILVGVGFSQLFTLLFLYTSVTDRGNDGELLPAYIAIPLILIPVAIGSWLFRFWKNVQRFYKLVDTYRGALLDNGVRSIKDFAILIDSSPDEIVDELKELQEAGFFRNFSIDRKNMLFIENVGWEDSGTNKDREVTFSCSACGANNSIYTNASSSFGVCEYCSTSVALNE